ncbi:MAG: hypothetical protein COA53_09660 [Rhodobacteraceae bacterium]|nr:MAG: hypothetical protein COA53_09660 [Paracoccaceae bacterium]
MTILTSPHRKAARAYGVLYLIIAVFGAFAIAYVPSVVIAALLTIVTFGELAFAFWLLIKGINLPSAQVKS